MPQRGVRRHDRVHVAVGDALGMELLLDPAIDTHRGDASHVARARAERQPVEDMCSLLARGQFPGNGSGK